MKNSIFKIPLLIVFTFLIGLSFGSINAFYEFSTFSYVVLLFLFVTAISIIGTLITLKKGQKSNRKNLVKFILNIIGWSAVTLFFLVMALYILFGGRNKYL